jgi:hypothetical protein
LMQPVAKKGKPPTARALMSKSGNLYTARTELDWVQTAGGVTQQYQQYATEMKIAFQHEFALGAREVVSETQQGIEEWKGAGKLQNKHVSPHLREYTHGLAAFLEEEAQNPGQSMAASDKDTERQTIETMFDEISSWGVNFADPYDNLYYNSNDESDEDSSDDESKMSSRSRSRSQNDSFSRTYAGGKRGDSDERERSQRQVTFADDYGSRSTYYSDDEDSLRYPDSRGRSDSFDSNWRSRSYSSSYRPYSADRGRADQYDDSDEESFYEDEPFFPPCSTSYDSSSYNSHSRRDDSFSRTPSSRRDDSSSRTSSSRYGSSYGKSDSRFWSSPYSSTHSDGVKIEEVDDDGQPIHPPNRFGKGKGGGRDGY